MLWICCGTLLRTFATMQFWTMSPFSWGSLRQSMPHLNLKSNLCCFQYRHPFNSSPIIAAAPDSHVAQTPSPKLLKDIVRYSPFPSEQFTFKSDKYGRTVNIKTFTSIGDNTHQMKHCQRHNGPEGWVLLNKVTSLGHIASSYTNLYHISSSESRPSNNFKISTKHQHFD